VVSFSGMAVELWTPVASMVGVLLGGGLTFATQRATQRAVERAEERKRATELAEARRTEQVQALMAFTRFALEAEGAAHARPPVWTVGDAWYATARPAVDGLRVAELNVEMLCDKALAGPAARYTRALNQAVWQDRQPDEVSIGDRLDPLKAEFLAVARRTLDLSEDPVAPPAPA
jgi:hypothetical protein